MSAALEAIEVKKRGGGLPEDMIRSVVAGYAAGEVPDYQMSALLMAIFTRGMVYEETLALTAAMADSGGRYSFPECVDKHSTGGIGDKISLTSLPIAAACGAPVAKLSGRGLGQTGGTVDKLEAIPGFTCDLSESSFRRQVEEVGLAIVEAGEVAPADKEIYALRDVTGTVDSLPLIGSSIVSKKAATGAGHLLYDVKCGSGAFMKTAAEARELAELLVRLSESLGIRASALITGMAEPLGAAVGNALELRESLALLRGEPVPEDLDHEARLVAARLLYLKGISDAEAAVDRAISSGAAYEKLREFVAAQGGEADALESLAVSEAVREVVAPEGGYVAGFDALSIGQAALVLGAGRERKTDAVDHSVGVEALVKVGEEIEAGQPVARLYGERRAEEAERLVKEALSLSSGKVEAPTAILDSL
ncbi:thymidine phosphorylase [Rubrobacter aplysinae]|uniref:thymidine phosphorylase n=1 Tax=Rubrobacter aplysinae TaxID=909625 RepID=UPI000A00C5B3|nr:thymidine phosphorylase [Rubrobacter aplysinae]